MASEINTNNIDTEYPRAGEDNSTQGLRDNFVSIKTNIDTAKTEIEDLQDNTARTDELTNFNSSTIFNAGLRSVSNETVDLGNIDQDTEISFLNGSYQTLTVNDNIVLTFSGWPETGKHASILLEITRGDNISVNPAIIIDPLDNQSIKYDGKWPEPFLLSNSDRSLLVEISSADNGSTLYVSYHGAYATGFTDSYDVRNLLVTNDIAVNGNLTVNGSLQVPDLEVPVDLSALDDVSISQVSDYQALKYDPETEQWQNQDLEPIEFIEVVVNDDDSGNQDIFYLDQTKLTDLVDFTLDVGKIYRFDISDPSNVPAALRFSTTPDTNVPDSITEYDDNVIINGTAGEEGAYVQIKITEDTPNPLYLWGVENPLDTSGIGGGEDGAIKVGIKRKSGVFDELKGTLTGSVLADDETEIINSSDGKVVGQVEPSGFVLPSLTQSERDELDLVTGTMVFNTDTNKAQIYIDPAGWSDLN